MKKDEIKLSPKYGVNPSVMQCFWCGKDVGVALLGKINRDDPEAPRTMVANYDPCDECEEKWKQGVVIISVSDTPQSDGQPEIQPDYYPTGGHAVVKEEAIPQELLDKLADKEMKIVFMDQPEFNEQFKDQLDKEV